MKPRYKILIIMSFLVLFPIQIMFAQEPTLPHDPYTDDERLQLASEKKFTSEETIGGGSGMGYFDESDFNLSTVIIAIPIGVGSALVLVYYLRKGRLNRF